ncbi:MAG: carboxymuconolactone decarboxylase family protein [Afipia sp.]|jgi:AhpD family alkylhydroperoxidase|nr:carboxymuconolactone decarboxylase family protein [Afipia sp.]
MPKDYTSITHDISEFTRELGKLVPDTMKGFYALSKSASADGHVDQKTKELIALAIGVTQHCDGCIGFHVRTLKKLGASREEIAEVLGMCVYMGGGPALMYAADALRAYDQFAAA